MKILVGLIEHIGDIVACEPVSRYLRIKYPASHISWVVSKSLRELVDYNPNIDEVIPVDCLTDWIKISNHSQDYVVDLHVNYRICQHCRVSLVKKHGNPFVNAYEWFDCGSILEAFSVGAGLPRLSAHPEVYITPTHQEAVSQLELPPRYVVIHRESNDTAKDWVSEKWKDLADIIRDRLGLPIVEVGAGKSSISPLGDRVDLVNKLPILQTAEVIRRAALFVGIDSGPAHLANAVRTPGVVLLGRLAYFRKYNPFSGFFAGNTADVRLVSNLVGPASQIPVEDVQEAAEYVLSAEPTRTKPTLTASPTPQGAIDGVQEILDAGIFDPAWYQLHNPDVATSGLTAPEHYLAVGTREGRSPGPAFDVTTYRKSHPDVAQAGVDPLLHFIRAGASEARKWNAVSSGHEPPWPPAEPSSGNELRLGQSPTHSTLVAHLGEEVPRTFAFYLPQFHPINENDWAHGEGFTEWSNVVRARPLFRGHDQPKEPGELGYYDLRAEEVMERQIDLARQHLITGFCFYYYYFSGRRLLQKPIENFIKSPSNMPFFFLWANENWSKRWDGGDAELIIGQDHSAEDDLLFIKQLRSMFEDSRYLKIQGRPVLMVYKVHLLPSPRETAERWRVEIEKMGFPGIYLVMVDDWFETSHPRDFGFDASYEIPSNVLPPQVTFPRHEELDLVDGFSGRIIDYRRFASYHMARPFPPYKRFRTVMLPWDNTARYGKRAIVHIDGHNEAYRNWLLEALLDSYKRYDPPERLVFLHSWNEWCEGTYLEPDKRHGRYFLEQTRSAIQTAQQAISMAGPDGLNVVASLLEMQKAKDQGAFRVWQAAQMSAGYSWKDAERARAESMSLKAQLARRP